MRDRWVGLQLGVDAHKWAVLLQRAHGSAVESGHVPPIVRDVVAESWRRCAEIGVDADERGAPLALDERSVDARWREHPLAGAEEVLLGILGSLLHDARHIVVVSDADGCLLWSAGHPELLRASESIEFTPDHDWSEAVAGTNAVGTALATDHAVQIFSAEHFRCSVHGWQCSGAPVHDPDTGKTLGVIDITGSYRTAHPNTFALVQTAASLVESHLRSAMLARDAGILALFAEHASRHGGPAAAVATSGRVLAATTPSWRGGRLEVPAAGGGVILPDGSAAVAEPLGEGLLVVPVRGRRPARRPLVRIELLGRDHARLTTPAGVASLTERHSEIVALLALHPEGLSGGDLAQLLFGEAGHEAAVRVEFHRLRDVLGPVLATRPYRLQEVEVDLSDVVALLEEGRLPQARSRAAGPLLPASRVAAITAARRRIAAALR